MILTVFSSHKIINLGGKNNSVVLFFGCFTSGEKEIEILTLVHKKKKKGMQQPRYFSHIHPRVDKAVPVSGQAALDPQRSKPQPAVEWSRLEALLQKEVAPRVTTRRWHSVQKWH